MPGKYRCQRRIKANTLKVDMSQDLGGGEGAEALFVLDEVAGGLQAGGAGEIKAHDVFELAVGSSAARFGGTEKGDERFVHCRSGMHGAGVIGDQ